MNRLGLICLIAGSLPLLGCGVTPPKVARPKAVTNPQQVVASQGYPVAQATFTSTTLPMAAAMPPPLQPTPSELPAIKPMNEKSEQEVAMDALGRIGPPAVPVLTEALLSPDANVRLAAAQTLARMGSDAKDAVPALVRLLDDPDERIRKAATRALGHIGPDAAAAIPALMRTLEQPNP